MKQSFLLLLLFFCLVLPVGGQNLVSNGSFEEMVDCPTGPGQIVLAQDWDAARESPDYFHYCANISLSSYGVPNNSFGHQYAATGNAYVGMRCYNSAILSREIIRGILSTPLTIGQEYFVTFKVSHSDDTAVVRYSLNNFGINLSTEAQNNVSIDNAALFYADDLVSDTLNWTTISGSFVADSAYQYLMIGNFFDDSNIELVDNGGAGFLAYYFLDDVCLSTDSLLCANFPSSVENSGTQDPITLYPNPAHDLIRIVNRLNIPFDVEIYNSVGQLLYTTQNITSSSFQLDISTYNSGLLFIKTISPKNQLIHKLIKQ
jgi:hypothetical protein